MSYVWCYYLCFYVVNYRFEVQIMLKTSLPSSRLHHKDQLFNTEEIFFSRITGFFGL
jgi:hypothetical protein